MPLAAPVALYGFQRVPKVLLPHHVPGYGHPEAVEDAPLRDAVVGRA
jgi:hypothetical protein